MTEQPDYGEVHVRLTARGYYIWSIRLPLLRTDEAPKFIARRLRDFDKELKETFPRHIKTTTSKFVPTDAFDDA